MSLSVKSDPSGTSGTFQVNATDVLTLTSALEVNVNGVSRNAFLTNNTLSFNLASRNNFICTPTGSGTLAFTNIPNGQSGTIIFVNGANYAISKPAALKVDAAFLALISATGTYRISYITDGTNVYASTSMALS